MRFRRNAEGVYELRRERRPVKELAGSLRYDGPAKSLEEMDEGIVAGVSRIAGKVAVATVKIEGGRS